MRKVIAERMFSSLRHTAQLTIGRTVSMDSAVAMRTQLVESWRHDNVRPTYTDLIVAAVGRALKLHPRLNSSLTGDEILLHEQAHVGLAVALPDGLVVPVIRAADELSLREVSIISSSLARRARAGELGPDDMTGSTFTVSALGASGIEWFTPVLNPPEAAILGVGTITDGLRLGPDGPEATKSLTLSLTIDHRIVDGAVGAEFLTELAALLEDPWRLLA
jgi:pyruvate dehydrogenase E2 component (dihydrolipoamide acetyltransferase)